MRPGHALHGWNHAFSNFIIHKVLFQLLQTASISAIHVQSAQSIVLKVPLKHIIFLHYPIVEVKIAISRESLLFVRQCFKLGFANILRNILEYINYWGGTAMKLINVAITTLKEIVKTVSVDACPACLDACQCTDPDACRNTM